MSNNYEAQGQVLAPKEYQAKLAEGVTFDVVVESITPENHGIKTAVINARGEKEEVDVNSDFYMARCVYPNGLVKNHQVLPNGSDLAEKILLTFKSQYQVSAVEVLNQPGFDVGSAFTIGSV